jgi:hypothetical protein
MRLIIGIMLAATLAAQVQTPLTIMQNSGTGTGELRMQERASNGQQYVGLKAPDLITSSVTWTLPNADGTAGRGLTTNGSGALAWSQVFLQGGNNFGADAVIGTNTSNSLQFETNGTLRWAIVPGGSLWAVADGAYDIGTSTNYRPSNVFITGTYTGANFAGAPAGTTGNYVSTRKLEIVDQSGGTSFWDIQASASTGASSLLIRDNGGNSVINFVRVASSSPVDYAEVYTDLLPNPNNGQKLGSSSFMWSAIHVTDIYTSGGSVYGHLDPSITATYTLGSSGRRWNKVWAVEMDASSGVQIGGNVTFASAGAVGIGTNATPGNHFFANYMTTKLQHYIPNGGQLTLQTGASVAANGNTGVSVSGASCTVKRIDYGIVTDATCP